MKWLRAAVAWRWTPFFALTGGTLLVVLMLAFLVPARIGDTTRRPAARGRSRLRPGTSRRLEPRPTEKRKPSPGPTR